MIKVSNNINCFHSRKPNKLRLCFADAVCVVENLVASIARSLIQSTTVGCSTIAVEEINVLGRGNAAVDSATTGASGCIIDPTVVRACHFANFSGSSCLDRSHVSTKFQEPSVKLGATGLNIRQIKFVYVVFDIFLQCWNSVTNKSPKIKEEKKND